MFDIIKVADELFGTTASSYKEIIPEFVCEYRLKKQNLPSSEKLIVFLGLKPERDKIEITITSDSGSAFVSSDVVWVDSYEGFEKGLYDDDEITVSIKVTKIIEGGRLSVYCLNQFSQFLCGLKAEQIFENFTNLFRESGEHIEFQLLDTNGSLRTSSIAFSDNDLRWINHRSREEQIKDCEDASVFLERAKIRLTPRDFEIEGLEGNGLDAIQALFGKLKAILSYVYLANTASVVNGKAILQFDPAAKGYEYDLTQLTENEIVPQIYDWVFKDESCVDKASIARKIINTYCRDKESILLIDEKVLNSIKSDYVIYQKNHADQYIEMKNKISEFIVESAGKIQDLSHDIADAFRNNFVAIIVFLMTVLLTDSIDFSKFLEKDISPKVTAVCGVFTIATFLYFIATIVMGKQKWKWLKQSYTDLKNNYVGVFDAKDIEEAFNHDEPLNNAEKEYREIRKKISSIWIALVLVLCMFTGILIWQGRHISMVRDPAESIEQTTDVIDQTDPLSNEADAVEE